MTFHTLLFFGLTGAQEHKEVSFCFVLFCFNTFAGFISGFHTSRNLGTLSGDRFSFSVARDQMLVARGDQEPLEHSLAVLIQFLQIINFENQLKYFSTWFMVLLWNYFTNIWLTLVTTCWQWMQQFSLDSVLKSSKQLLTMKSEHCVSLWNQNPLKSCENFNGKITRFSCNFNKFFLV